MRMRKSCCEVLSRLDLARRKLFPLLGKKRELAMFSLPCFYVHFEVSHQKRVMESENFETKKSYFAKMFLCILM